MLNRKSKHIFCSITFFSENRAVYEIMWENPVGSCRPQMEIWRMRIVCWMPAVTNTHSEYIILITSRDRGSTVVKVLRYKSEGRWFDPS